MRFIKYILTGIFFLFVCSSTVSSQTQNELPRELITAFKQGNSISLSNFFGNRIELSIEDKEAIYSKSQAKQIMAKFFREYPPTDFKKKHTGGKPGANYVIGDLITKKGKFRVNFLIKKNTGKFVIHRLNIEKN
ncbi:DUF4783 domain-containing protein [Labilibaculum sp. DW002]|uniref:DUF4783 domain-containing protein n=1 Tax=Paralabilibaculum antarcticum TaxID=2912572 RepID=A0ABT5VY65_9BACT|nr:MULTISPECIES: DUF4783 domain-containing protein [unclassified Labilibaculum]MBI9059063.1 DUF4783 domain-containing protein [Labilibaculum sp.]MDE5420348.1 DUF4783 domain-containing protein [Labilibaculum sp. DW002]